MPRERRRGSIVFMAVWMVFWTAAILIALYALGAEALDGEAGAVLFLAIWVGAAVFALHKASRTLLALARGDAGPPRRRNRTHRWDDALPAANDDPAVGDSGQPGGAGAVPPPAPDGGWHKMPRVPRRED